MHKNGIKEYGKHVVALFVMISVLSLGIYSLSLFEEKPPKELPLPVEKVLQYENRINELGEKCGFEDGNCKLCLKCVDEYGMQLAKENFKEEEKKSGTCEYVEQNGYDHHCAIQDMRCNGQGNCVECFMDEHCGDCQRCAMDFFNYPTESRNGICVPKETAKGKLCQADGEEGICYHGECVECFADRHCYGGLCEEGECI
jgi:hypothetical protein